MTVTSEPVVADSTIGAAATEARFGALDALRGAAMFLGVCLHAAVSYMTGRMPGLVWGTYDSTTSPFFDLLFWWLHSWRLPVFFFLAGFFAALVETARGPKGLLAHRARRLLAPFVVGCLVLLPISFYIWSAGWLVSGRCNLKEVLAIKFGAEIQAELYGPMHLWFLQDLHILNVCWCAFRWARRGDRRKEPSLASRGPWFYLALPLGLAGPTAVILAGNLRPVVEHHNSFVPDGWRLLYYGAYFVAGTALYHRRNQLREVFRFWPVHLALSLPATLGAMYLLQGHLRGAEGVWALAAALSLLAWLSLFGVVGLCLRYARQQRPAWRYLADASYWVYLCHLPLVGLIQLDLEGAPLPAGVKFLVVVGLTTFLCLASYHALVRYTFLGSWLHGSRKRVSGRSQSGWGWPTWAARNSAIRRATAG
jgi:peptidoglycan/LPS O-acetylase OafA/YrhL